MKHILLFGAGKSSTFLIEYLVQQLPSNNWTLTVLDANQQAAQEKLGHSPNTYAYALDVENEKERNDYIRTADIVISLLPPALHYHVALSCLQFSKHLLTASYVDSKMQALRSEIERKGLLFLCEMGLDPGIDHMSAMQIIHRLQKDGARITSFKSHCGGLIAPESDDNPWRHKISWNPKNIVLAGKGGATYRDSDYEKVLLYEELFDSTRVVNVPPVGAFAWYPNRDSLPYIDIYNVDSAHHFVRTTLRYPEFCFGWKNIVELKLTDESEDYDTDGMSLKRFFQIHLNRHGFSEWIKKHITTRFIETKSLLEKLQQVLSAEEEIDEDQMKELREFMLVDHKGQLLDVNLEDVKTNAAATVAEQVYEANLTIRQLLFLGLGDDKTIINKGRCSAAGVLQFAVEKKLALNAGDRDMIVMLHEIEHEKRGVKRTINSKLILKGEDEIRTAMAKTVGLPLGIAAKLVLQDKINLRGLHIPILPAIYEPVLSELKEHGIVFDEWVSPLPPTSS